MASPNEKIALYLSLFRGRDDIFARRWERGEKSGYSPAYSFDWAEFNAHRSRGGSMKDFDRKTPIPLEENVILRHLQGQDTIGIYPILASNTSFFLAADFDHENWLEDCRKYQDGLVELGLTTYIERSRGHRQRDYSWIIAEFCSAKRYGRDTR
jgi:hypothetical protein